MGGTYLGQVGTWLGVPTLDGGYLPTYLPLHPDLARGERVPTLDKGVESTYLGRSTPLPPYVNRQTPVKTIPSRRTTYVKINTLKKILARLVNCDDFGCGLLAGIPDYDNS